MFNRKSKSGEKKQKPKHSDIQTLTRWFVSGLLGACAICFAVYYIGGIREFRDSTQLGLLNITSFACLLLAAWSFFGFAYHIFLFFRNKKNRCFLLHGLIYLIPLAAGIAASFFILFIISAAGGNTGH